MEGKEHLNYLAAKNKDKSVLWLHSIHHYKRRNDVRYAMRVSGVFKSYLVNCLALLGVKTKLNWLKILYLVEDLSML